MSGCDSNLVTRDDLYKVKRQADFIVAVGTGGPDETVTNPDNPSIIVPTVAYWTREFEEALRNGLGVNIGEYNTNPTITQVNQYVTYSGTLMYTVKEGTTLPYTIDSATYPDPNNDPDLVAYGNASQEYVRDQIAKSNKLFATVAAAETSTDLALGDSIETHFYNAQIVQQWKVVAADPSPEYGKQAANGLWLQEVSNDKFFESFGAFGNGTDSDNVAFTFAESYNGRVLGNPKATYNVSIGFDLTNSARWEGQWCKVNLTGSAYFATVGTNCYLGEFDVDGLDEDHTAYPVAIATPSENAQIGDMKYRNMHGKTSFQTYPCKIPLYGAKGFTIGYQKFFNILQDDDGSVTGKGFVGGVYFVGVDAEVPLGKSHGTVEAIYGDGVRSVDAGSGVVQDSDLLRFFCETEDNTPFDIVIGPVIGRNVHKRIVKASSIASATIGDVYSFNEDTDNPYTLHAAVEALSTGGDFKFGNVYVEGPSQRCVWFKSKGNTCGDIFDGGGGYGAVFGDATSVAVSCQVGDIIGRGNDAGGSQGIGVRLYNANLCNAGNITGLFNVSIQTDPENAGSSTIGDVTCNGRMNLQYGATMVGKINVDVTAEPVAGAHFTVGENTKFSESEIITDGRYTMGIVGGDLDVDLGRMRIVRKNSSNGDENNHSVVNSTSATSGILRGKLEVEVNAAVPGTPSGSSGKTLVYLSGINIDDFDLSMNITAPSRGATGFNYWLNNVNGQANRIAVKSVMPLVGSQLNGKIGVTKLENLVPGGSTVTCTGEVNVFLIEKDSAAVINGTNNTPVTVDSTR